MKGDRCFTPKCAIVKRAYAPGVHGRASVGKFGPRRRSSSEFGRQLIQKQSIKKSYGVFERQLKRYFNEAHQEKGDTRENLMRKLETRLDNVIFRLGWVKSRAAARQMVSHGHILVNRRRVNIPSYGVSVGDEVNLNEKIKKTKATEDLLIALKKYEAPAWLYDDKEKFEGKVINLPGLNDLGDLAPIGLIVEFYSR